MSTLEFNINEDRNKQAWDAVQAKLNKIKEGGGPKAEAKQNETGKLLARERIDYPVSYTHLDVYTRQVQTFMCVRLTMVQLKNSQFLRHHNLLPKNKTDMF